MKNRNFLTVFIVMMLSLALVFASCDKAGDETTAAPDTTLAPAVTDTPTEPAEETTNVPDTTAVETTSAPETTATPETTVAEETTKAEETTEPPHIHSYGTWVTVKVASCTEEGTQERVCSCGEKETETVAKLAHRESAWITDKEANCTEAGSKHTECEVCKATIKTDTIPAEGHTDGAWIIDKEASATSDGSKHLECAVCKATLKTEVIPATPHTPGAWIVDKEPTCTETGLRHRACTKCGETVDTETISAKGHTEVIDAAKAATCTEEGLTEGKHCSVCKAVTVAQATVPVKAHTEVIDAAKEATCTATGLTEGKHCSVCNAVTKAQEIIPVKAHTEVTDAAKAATCTEEGLTEGKRCSVCNAVTKAQETVPAKGHNEVTDAAKAATCTEEGLTEGKHCSVCNVVTKAQEKIPTEAHTESDWIIDKAATTAAEGSKHTECTVCKTTIKTESIPKVEIPKLDYSVTVKTGTGAPVPGVEVIFTKGSTEVAKVKTDKDGKAVAKLEEGEYEYSVNADSTYFVSADNDSLTKAAPAVEVVLVTYVTNAEYIYPDEKNGIYRVNLGSVRVPVAKGEMRYFFFTPAEGAVYKVYTDSDKVEVGYYGGSFYVYSNNSGEMEADGSMKLQVLLSQVGNTFVLGLQSTSASVEECTLTIEKFSDVQITIEELEWVPYKPDTVVEKIETPAGYIVGMDLAVWTPFDSAATEIPVYFNEKDGYYHLESVDGPVLYVRIGSKSSYQEALTTIVGTSNLGVYIYDENGEFVKKERYNEIIDAYAAASDTKYNVYPLTEDLYYVLHKLADDGWYDKTSPNYIFSDEGIVVMPFNGWLFACVYFK